MDGCNILISKYGAHADSLNDSRMAWTKAYLEQKGMPAPDGGISVVPEKMSTYNEAKEQRVRFKKDIQ